MKISFQKRSDTPKLIRFNLEAFPKRSAFIQQLMEFRYFNPLNKSNLIENNVLAFDDDENIIGQALYHPAKYFFNSELHEMQWGFDLFVRPDKRNEFIGIHLFEYIKANKSMPIFAAGLGDKALKIQKFFGYRVIGELKKYYKIVNPLYVVIGLVKAANIPTAKFPENIGKPIAQFKKAAQSDLWECNSPYNENLLEFARDKDFIRWRFYSKDFQYAVYRLESSHVINPIFFVARTIKIKGITSLLIADYRYDVNKPEGFQMVLDAARHLASKLMLPIVVTGSSHHTTDGLLEMQKFKITGRNRPIVVNSQDYKSDKERIDKRDFIFFTLADSDGEYLI